MRSTQPGSSRSAYFVANVDSATSRGFVAVPVAKLAGNSTRALSMMVSYGAGTIIGPFVGTLLMFYIAEFSSEYTSAYKLVVGLVLVLLILFFPKGIAGSLRERFAPWLP